MNWHSLYDLKKNLYIDSWPKILLFRTHHLCNSTTEPILVGTKLVEIGESSAQSGYSIIIQTFYYSLWYTEVLKIKVGLVQSYKQQFGSGLRKFALDLVIVIFFKNAEKMTSGGLIQSLEKFGLITYSLNIYVVKSTSSELIIFELVFFTTFCKQ